MNTIDKICLTFMFLVCCTLGIALHADNAITHTKLDRLLSSSQIKEYHIVYKTNMLGTNIVININVE